ncbi:Hypothetical predicted protein [Mytilus galloprovincialis]|uniref:Uncharacterized protein n=1 Tax=Mytilus galloprovincialis TaxID=29158 RepID=A0A8B6E4R1_MYTGA|nr:Hypothetical predicted protein [Mytilus galloprovincialis]
MLNRVVVTKYFEDLEKVITDNNLTAVHIWNMDETGKQFEHNPTNVCARKGSRNVLGQTSNSRENVTILASVNAEENVMPPINCPGYDDHIENTVTNFGSVSSMDLSIRYLNEKADIQIRRSIADSQSRSYNQIDNGEIDLEGKCPLPYIIKGKALKSAFEVNERTKKVGGCVNDYDIEYVKNNPNSSPDQLKSTEAVVFDLISISDSPLRLDNKSFAINSAINSTKPESLTNAEEMAARQEFDQKPNKNQKTNFQKQTGVKGVDPLTSLPYYNRLKQMQTDGMRTISP